MKDTYLPGVDDDDVDIVVYNSVIVENDDVTDVESSVVILDELGFDVESSVVIVDELVFDVDGSTGVDNVAIVLGGSKIVVGNSVDERMFVSNVVVVDITKIFNK